MCFPFAVGFLFFVCCLWSELLAVSFWLLAYIFLESLTKVVLQEISKSRLNTNQKLTDYCALHTPNMPNLALIL